VTGEPESRTICHCRSCRRASGAPSVAWAVFRSSEFKFLSGETVRFGSSPGVVRAFCGRCGTPLTYQNTTRPEFVDVQTATLDDPEAFPPAKEIWTEHRIAWEPVNEAIPQFPRSSLIKGEEGS
jgi:hypothetical protein